MQELFIIIRMLRQNYVVINLYIIVYINYDCFTLHNVVCKNRCILCLVDHYCTLRYSYMYLMQISLFSFLRVWNFLKNLETWVSPGFQRWSRKSQEENIKSGKSQGKVMEFVFLGNFVLL